MVLFLAQLTCGDPSDRRKMTVCRWQRASALLPMRFPPARPGEQRPVRKPAGCVGARKRIRLGSNQIIEPCRSVHAPQGHTRDNTIVRASEMLQCSVNKLAQAQKQAMGGGMKTFRIKGFAHRALLVRNLSYGKMGSRSWFQSILNHVYGQRIEMWVFLNPRVKASGFILQVQKGCSR
uniref:Transposase n=1 Tax=Panagrellus redivivus TaxID=6233 RepID=A0A7E4VCD7_PANRE